MSETRSTFDSVLDLCRHQHRRVVLALLAAEEQSLTLNDLTQAVLKHNHQKSRTEVSEDVLTEGRLSLHHVHLTHLREHSMKQRMVPPIARQTRRYHRSITPDSVVTQ